MTEQPTTDEPMTDTEWLIVMMLTKTGQQFIGTIAWLCRYAWLWYTLPATRDTELDIDALIAREAPGFNRPDQATTRSNIIDCINYLKRCAAKPPRWPLPGNPADYDISQWITRDDALKVNLWAPTDDTPTGHPPASTYAPAKWDGRPFPGRCQHQEGSDQCGNQAAVGHGHWDGGAPGQGEWQWDARCLEHIGTEG